MSDWWNRPENALWRRSARWNAKEVTGAAALYALLTWMRRRRGAAELQQAALQGGMGVVATMAFQGLNEDLGDATGFWDTAQYLIATYGAYEAFQLVRFNLDYFRAGYGSFEILDDEQLRPTSRMLLSSSYFPGSSQTNWPRFSLSGTEELKPLLMVMAAALLFERLKLRRTINTTPFQLLGLYALSKEKPVTRDRQ